MQGAQGGLRIHETEGIDMRVAAAVRVAAVGRVVKSGEQLSAVQLLRGVVTVSVVSGSRK